MMINLVFSRNKYYEKFPSCFPAIPIRCPLFYYVLSLPFRTLFCPTSQQYKEGNLCCCLLSIVSSLGELPPFSPNCCDIWHLGTTWRRVKAPWIIGFVTGADDCSCVYWCLFGFGRAGARTFFFLSSLIETMVRAMTVSYIGRQPQVRKIKGCTVSLYHD